jgi:hypothetical protein
MADSTQPPRFADRPLCSLIGGPSDGFTFRWNDDKTEARFEHENGRDLVYVREPGTTKFRFQGYATRVK